MAEEEKETVFDYTTDRTESAQGESKKSTAEEIGKTILEYIDKGVEAGKKGLKTAGVAISDLGDKSVKGIGLKSAQRLVLELKDKIVKGEGSADSTLFKADHSALAEEATTALVMLGFSKANIGKVLPAILKDNPSGKVEDIIKAALKRL